MKKATVIQKGTRAALSAPRAVYAVCAIAIACYGTPMRAGADPLYSVVVNPQMSTTEIQRAMDHSDRKGAVYFRPGVYNLYGPLYVQSGRTYVGAGSPDPIAGSWLRQTIPGQPVFAVAPPFNSPCWAQMPATVTITGLTFDGVSGTKGISSPQVIIGPNGETSTDFATPELVAWTLRNNYFTDGLQEAIDVPMVVTRIERNTFGIKGMTSADPGRPRRHIRSVYPEGVAHPAVCKQGPVDAQRISNANWIVKNIFTNAKGGESVLFEAGVQLQLFGNTFRNNDTSRVVQINGMVQVAIDGNRFEGNAGEALIHFANSRHRNRIPPQYDFEGAEYYDGNRLVRMQNNHYDMQRCDPSCTTVFNKFVFYLDANTDDGRLSRTHVFMGNESGAHFSHTDGTFADLTHPMIAAAGCESGSPIYLSITGPFNIADYKGAQTNDCSGAQFVSQSMPSTMTPGQSYKVSVTMRNTGKETWPASGSYKLGSRNPENTMIWGVNRVNAPQSVAPGSHATFEVFVTAPSAPGAYNFQWQMVQEPARWFGDVTPNIQASVASPIKDESRFVTQSVPATMVAGQRYNVVIRMRNTGASTWTSAGGYRLLSQRPQGNAVWAVSSIDVPTAGVVPNAEVTFSFQVTAPPVAGNYTFEWRMVRNGLGFGDVTPAVPIAVANQ